MSNLKIVPQPEARVDSDGRTVINVQVAVTIDVEVYAEHCSTEAATAECIDRREKIEKLVEHLLRLGTPYDDRHIAWTGYGRNREVVLGNDLTVRDARVTQVIA